MCIHLLEEEEEGDVEQEEKKRKDNHGHFRSRLVLSSSQLLFLPSSALPGQASSALCRA